MKKTINKYVITKHNLINLESLKNWVDVSQLNSRITKDINNKNYDYVYFVYDDEKQEWFLNFINFFHWNEKIKLSTPPTDEYLKNNTTLFKYDE